MKVFTLYSAAYARNLRLWAESWENNGYTPQLISLRELMGRTIKQVVRRRGGGLVVRPGDFNVSLRRGKPVKRRHGAPGWRKASVVNFTPDVDEKTILECLGKAH